MSQVDKRAGTMGEMLDVQGPFEIAPFGNTLADLADERDDIVGLTADMAKYSDIIPFRDRHPDRYFNVGMAEADLISISAGLGKSGYVAYCTTYSAFIVRRALDFVILGGAHSMANVKIIAGMPGLVNPYGATHQAIDDLAVLRMVPNLTVIDPADATELKQVVRAIADVPGTVYVRNLRGKVPVDLDPARYTFQLGKAQVLNQGSDVGIISSGFMTGRAMQSTKLAESRGVSAGHLHISTIKPFDHEGALEFASQVDRLVVAENHRTTGGLATLVAETLYDAGIMKPIIRVGIGDRFHECGSQSYIEQKYGMDQTRLDRAVVEGY